MKRALLIGIPTFPRAGIQDLPVARRDVSLLEETLHRSGYEDIRVRGVDDPFEVTRNEIDRAIYELCSQAGKDDTLLVYISSHGLHHDGRDYIVPADAWWRDPRDFARTLVPIDFGAHADESNASTLVVFIDACREGIDIGVKGLTLEGWGQGKRERARTRHLVTCFACQPGEYARYVGGDDGFSLFARALATVLAPEHAARTVREVCEAVQGEIDALAQQHAKPRQELRVIAEMETGAEAALERVICEGAGASRGAALVRSPWAAYALAAELWNRESVRACPWLGLLQERVAAIADACWASVHERAQGDPWTDAEVPGRAVDALGLLCMRVEPAISLNANETALAVVAPFVHEAVLWAGRAEDLERAVDGRRRAMPQLVRRAERLVAQERFADAAAIDAWIAHKARLRMPQLALPEQVAAVVDVDAPGEAGGRIVAEVMRAERVFALSRCLISEPSFVQRDDRPGALRHEAPCGGYGEDRRVREKLLGYLLVIAGRLALDARMLADVVVEHLGLHDAVEPARAVETLRRAVWRPARAGLVLSGRCDHPAVDHALREHVNVLAGELDTIHRLASVASEASVEPLRALPVRAVADELGPAPRDSGAPSYELPHVSFHLASHEVQELLMGEQLYGDPTVAIRELYQNALDACRYRDARLTYLVRSGQLEAAAATWTGRITFRQGVDDGRPYIECEDNGIGMDQRVIAESFARAGRRFHDSPEFIEEQIEWQRCDPPVEMFPNSQFGIGVFSYFMLADEIELDTCRLSRDGRPGATLRVRISGSGSLFRVTSAPRPMRDAGTRVRLYLGRTEHKGRPVSAYHTLRRELWVAEYLTETIDLVEDKRFEWRPGELVHPTLKTREVLASGSPGLWWVPVVEAGTRRDRILRGAILADGLVVEGSMDCAVVNLVGAHRPQLTVDRRRVIGKATISKLNSINSGPPIDWPHLDYNWLWAFADEVSMQAADGLTSRLIHANVSLPCRELANITVPISVVGCFPYDALFLLGKVDAPAWLIRQRSHAWEHARMNLPEPVATAQLKPGAQKLLQDAIRTNVALRLTDRNVPVPACVTPLDAVLVSRRLNGYPPWIWSPVSQDHVRRAAEITGLSTAEVVTRLRKFEPFGLQIPHFDVAHG